MNIKIKLLMLLLVSQHAFSDFINQVPADESYFINGALSDTTIPKFLELAFSGQTDRYPEFKSASCLTASNIKSVGGYNTWQLFVITSTCTGAPKHFVIKEPASGLTEAARLNIVSQSELLKPIIWPNTLPDYPTIAAPIAILSYKSQGTLHYLIVMPQAAGKMLCNVIEDFRSAINKPDIARAYRQLGREIANFHNLKVSPDDQKVLGPSLVHGDAKCLNIFYDEAKNHFTYVDNESMALYLNNPSDRYIDIAKLLFGQFVMGEDARATIVKEFKEPDLIAWYNLSAKNFFEGYIEVFPNFPKEKREKAFEELRAMTKTRPAIFHSAPLLKLIETYIDPIFDELKKKYGF